MKRRRHAFKFRLPNEHGKENILTVWAKMLPAKSPVVLRLTAEDVRRSMKLGGVGNTQTCSMAVCAKRQADKFPHPVEGYIDWQYTMAYVVAKVDKKTGFPSLCYAYRHQDNIARLNDSKGGQKKLLAELEENGDRMIYLSPRKDYVRTDHRLRGGNDGSHSSKPAPRGAALRMAMAQLGMM